MPLGLQIVWLFILALPVASVSWTATHEELLHEPREYCRRRSQRSRGYIVRKIFYVFTCEYCLSHYVAAIFLIITRFKLLYVDWRGYMIAWFALVWVANFYMSLFGRLRLDIRRERVEIEEIEKDAEESK